MQFNEQLKIVGQPADFDVMSHVRKGIIYAGKHAFTVHIYTHNILHIIYSAIQGPCKRERFSNCKRFLDDLQRSRNDARAELTRFCYK